MSADNKPSKLCRICLSSEVKKYLSLFEKYREFSLNHYILLITDVNIEKDDGFPDKICSNCFIEFETALNFKRKCENSDTFLKKNKDKIIEVCANIDENDIIIVKKEEPYDEDIKLEEATDCSTIDEYYAVEALEDAPLDDIKPFKHRSKTRNFAEATDYNAVKGLDEISQDLSALKNKELKTRHQNFECHDCGNLFNSKCKLRVHWKKVHMLNSLICEVCKRRFKSYKAYHVHKKNTVKSCKAAGNNLVRIEGEGKSRVFHCTECKYKTIRVKDLQSHIVVHNGDRPFQCSICENRYTQQSSLQSHMESIHKKYIIEITCHYCGKQLKGRTQVYRHIKTHTEQKSPCTICQKQIRSGSLKRHMQRHTGIKLYTCEKCASTFYSLSELCNHRRWVHNKNDNNYKCDLCGYTASRPDRIKVHRKKHSDNNIPCTKCGMFFTTVQKLELHQMRHFQEKKHECPYCDMKFLRRDSINKHVKSKHKSLWEATKEHRSPVKYKVELADEEWKIRDTSLEKD